MERQLPLKRFETTPNSVDTIHEIIQKSQKIHCAFLFMPEGLKLRQKLCILLSGTKPSNLYAGWEEFGAHLDIHPAILKCIKYNFQHEDPTSNTLLAYSQNENATIAHILEAIHKIKRFDVVTQLEPEVFDMCNNISRTYTAQENNYVRPSVSVNCPFIFKDLTKISDRFDEQINAQFAIETVTTKKPTYKKTVLLTFSTDGAQTAKAVAAKLRLTTSDCRIGVVVLEEQLSHVNLNPEEFIFCCFSQVDYVMPIVTEEYVREVASAESVQRESCVNNIDALYVKYIYTLMNVNYLKSGCRNYKVRSLIPNDSLRNVLRCRIMRHPLFQVWFKSEDVESVRDKIINGTF